MIKVDAAKPAKLCYEHIGGKLGSLLLKKFLEKGWLEKMNATDKNFYITVKGEHEFAKLGIDLSEIKTEKI